MKTVLSVYKKQGQTPYEAILEFKSTHPKYAHETISYAGRLDPMAEGILLLLVGDENKKRNLYESLKKTYTFSVLCGVATDSYDLLGIPDALVNTAAISDSEIEAFIKDHTGSFLQPFPPFSSKPVNGIPLYKLSREKMLSRHELPTKKITVYSFDTTGTWHITSSDLLTHLRNTISHVRGDFRQGKILDNWEKLLSSQDHVFPVYDFTITCSSGTYIRGLAHDMGIFFNTSALAYQIKRTAVGGYTIQ